MAGKKQGYGFGSCSELSLARIVAIPQGNTLDTISCEMLFEDAKFFNRAGIALGQQVASVDLATQNAIVVVFVVLEDVLDDWGAVMDTNGRCQVWRRTIMSAEGGSGRQLLRHVTRPNATKR